MIYLERKDITNNCQKSGGAKLCAYCFAEFATLKALSLCKISDAYSLVQISKLMRDFRLSFKRIGFEKGIISNSVT